MKKVAILFIVLLTSSFVFAQNTYVPDDKFEQALIDLGYDTTLDDSVLTANISGVTSLDVSSKEISDLTGIEAFVALESLSCAYNELTSLDVTTNTALTLLKANDNQLTSLDVSNNTALEVLECYSNQLTSIDVSKNTALINLNSGYNQLTSLDVSKNVALTVLHCGANQLTSLDVSNNTALEVLSCFYNQLTSLDVSKNTVLEGLSCYSNQLTSLNMRNGVNLELYAFNATNNPNLTCIETLDPAHATTNLAYIDAGVTFSLSCMEDFEWVSSASDTINITESNLADTYTLQWESSNDESSVNYRVYAKIGVYPAEQMYDTTVTALSITYQEILEKVFEGSPTNGATVKFQVIAKKGAYSKDVTGDDRTLYISRYDYLSVENESIPTEFALHENYPNPFNPSTTLRFDLPEASNITLTIYNMLGQKVRTFDYQNTSAGYHSVKWNATNDYGDPVGAGVYLYQLQTKDFVKTRKMVLLK